MPSQTLLAPLRRQLRPLKQLTSIDAVYKRHMQFAGDSLLTRNARVREDIARHAKAKAEWEREHAKV